MKKAYLSVAIAFALYTIAGSVSAETAPATADTPPQSQSQNTADQQNAQSAKPSQYVSPSATSNTTTANSTARAQQRLEEIHVNAQALSLGGGLMTVQDASKAVSTITREAIEQAAPGATYAQMIESVPGVVAVTDDVTGLNDANYQIRGFTNDEIGATVNGAPINDSGNYRVYPTEYGDTQNMGDITVLQGYPDVDQPVAGAAGGTIAWATINPSHTPSVDLSLSGGSHDYEREFIRLQTGDTGPIRSWISFSNNSVDLWRGAGNSEVTKIDGKSVWTIDDDNSVTASLQYNREMKYGYFDPTKAQVAQYGYYVNWNTTTEGYTPSQLASGSSPTGYWALHTNPFRSYLFSLDGEFRLADTLRLSIVPYFQYGGGGGGGGTTFTESSATSNYNRYKYTNQDLNYDGAVSGSTLAYDLAQNYTWRPGIIAKFIQEIGHNDTLAYGLWLDEPRAEQNEPFANAYNGIPADVWFKTDANMLRYENGLAQYQYNEYTASSLRRVFLTNTWTPTDQWTVTLGGAYTWEERKGFDYEYPGATGGSYYQQQYGGNFTVSNHKFTPTAGIKYQLNDENQFYLGYGRSFRASINGALMQNYSTADFYKTPGGASDIGYCTSSTCYLTAAQVKALSTSANNPETAETVDLGWRYYADKVSASVDLYASNLKNKQVSGYDNDGGDTIYLTVPMLHQRGVNAEASYKLTDDFTLYGSYAYTKSTIEGNTEAFGDDAYTYVNGVSTPIAYPTQGKSFVNVPKNTAYVRLNYNHGPFWASFDVKYRGAYWADWMNTEKAGGFATLDFSTGWKFDDFSSWFTKPEIKLNAFNLADKHALAFAYNSTYLLSSSTALNNAAYRQQYYSGAAQYILLEPRSFMVTLSASFF